MATNEIDWDYDRAANEGKYKKDIKEHPEKAKKDYCVKPNLLDKFLLVSLRHVKLGLCHSVDQAVADALICGGWGFSGGAWRRRGA